MFRNNTIFFKSLLILFFSVSDGFSVDKSDINGVVFDKQTGETLGSVNVFLEHTSIGASTDLDGNFTISGVSSGKYNLIVTMVGYKPFEKVIDIEPADVKEHKIYLEPTVLQLGAVVVTGTGTQKLYEDMPVRTMVVPRMEIERKQAVNLAEALSMQTGVRVENDCNNCNFTQLRIHGLDGKYSQILVDGDPVVSSLAGVYGLEHFPEEMIEQIEIVKGGGSALYGGGAVGGTVNLITRRPRIQSVKISYLGNSIENAGDNVISAVVQMVGKERKKGAYIFGSVRQRNPYDRNNDGFSELGLMKNNSIGFNYYHEPIDAGEISAHFHHIRETRRGGNNFERPVHEAEIAEAVEHDRWGGAVRWVHKPDLKFDYRFYYSFALQTRDSYYGGLGGYNGQDSLEALQYYGKTKNPLHVSGLQANYQYGRHLISAGLEYSNDKINDKSTADPDYYIDDAYTNFGLYLQDDIHFGSREQLVMIIGARLDKHSEISDPVISPRLTGRYKIDGNLNLRSSFSSGFKAPQTFDEDLHLCGLEGDQRVVRNSEDLDPENSYSISGGFEYQGSSTAMPFVVDISAFHTKLLEVFTENYVGIINGLEVWERTNGGGAHVNGVEIDVAARPFRSLELKTGWTYKQSEYAEELEDFETKNFLRTPDVYGNLSVNYDLTADINVFTALKFTGSADVPHEKVVEGQKDPELVLEESDSFTEIDFGISYRLTFSERLNSYSKINIGVKNVFDAYQSDLDYGADRDPAYVYGPSLPRTYYAGFEVSF